MLLFFNNQKLSQFAPCLLKTKHRRVKFVLYSTVEGRQVIYYKRRSSGKKRMRTTVFVKFKLDMEHIICFLLSPTTLDTAWRHHNLLKLNK